MTKQLKLICYWFFNIQNRLKQINYKLFIFKNKFYCLNQSFPNFKKIKKLWPPSTILLKNYHWKHQRTFFFALYHLLQNIYCKFQIMTSWLPCGSFTVRGPQGNLAHFRKPWSKLLATTWVCHLTLILKNTCLRLILNIVICALTCSKIYLNAKK